METHNHCSHQEHSSHKHSLHEHSLFEELCCHFPYATFSVAFSFIALSLLQCISMPLIDQPELLGHTYHVIFHVLHYIHLLFATMGTVITFYRFSQNTVVCVLTALISPAIFCTLSDVALPALAGNILGMGVDLHICFTSLHDLVNVIPFMLIGILTGHVLAYHNKETLAQYSLNAHFIHILISSLAASTYIMSYGFFFLA